MISNNLNYAFLLIILITCLSACDYRNRNDAINNQQEAATVDNFQCLTQQSQCSFELANGRVEVLFNVDKIIAEQAFTLLINYVGDNTIVSISGYLEGVDMYMGKIPLFLEPSQPIEYLQTKKQIQQVSAKIDSDVEVIKEKPAQIFQGEVLVGSCSAEKMTWRMWLTFTTSNNKIYSKMLTITSQRR